LLVCTADLAAASDIVISQFYTSGGLAGATYRYDYIELFNRGTSPVDMTGMSLHLRGPAIPEWSKVADLTATIPAGGYYLIRGSSSAGNGIDLPTPDLIAGGLSTDNGSIVLSTVPDQFFCTANPPVSADRVGYGAWYQCPEGTEIATPALDLAALRNESGCADTENNLADFSFGPATPRNSASPPHVCGVTGVTPAAPRSGRLDDPRPSPSSGRTEFAFAVSRDGLVRLEVFDLRGRRVRTLVNGWRPAGAARATWDGARDDGAMVAAGVYFVRFTDAAGGTAIARRFVRAR
jgi:hypothetical protein